MIIKPEIEHYEKSMIFNEITLKAILNNFAFGSTEGSMILSENFETIVRKSISIITF